MLLFYSINDYLTIAKKNSYKAAGGFRIRLGIKLNGGGKEPVFMPQPPVGKSGVIFAAHTRRFGKQPQSPGLSMYKYYAILTPIP